MEVGSRGVGRPHRRLQRTAGGLLTTAPDPTAFVTPPHDSVTDLVGPLLAPVIIGVSTQVACILNQEMNRVVNIDFWAEEWLKLLLIVGLENL